MVDCPAARALEPAVRAVLGLVSVALGCALGSPASGACLSESTPAELDERLAAAETAYAELDPLAFGRALDDASLLLPCLSEVAGPAVAAKYHRLEGLRLYAAGKQPDALGALRAARTLEPAYTFPDALLPADHALRQAYESLPTAEGRTERPPQPRGGVFAFDGVLGPRRPVERATLLQLVEADGGVSQTSWVSPGEAMPAYRARPRTRDRFLLGSSILFAASAGLYGWAWTTHAPFDDPAVTDVATLEALQAKSRTLSAASGAALALGTGGVVLAFTLGQTDR